MSVIRTQYGVVSASVTVNNNASNSVDLPRPADAAEGNTLDWVTRPAFRKEFESGRCVIKAGTATMGVAKMLVTKIEIVALNPGNSLAPIDLSFSQFPSPPVAGQSPVLRTILDLTAAPTTSPYTMLIDGTTKDWSNNLTKELLSSILVRTGEFVRVTMYNDASGAPITGTLEARYDFGLNSGNYGSIPLLI